MLTDRYGLAISTASPTAREAYVEGCDLLFSGYPSPVEAFDRAVAADPNFALANAGKARAHQLRGEMVAAREAMTSASTAAAGLPAREASHVAFYDLVVSGQGDAAVAAAKEYLSTWPRDAMVLGPCTSVFGLIGFSGRFGREREQVDLLDSLATHYGDDWWFNSQHAFALVETGQRDAARPMIERALVQYPCNAHGVHIRAHVYYEDGEQEASRRYLRSWLPSYPRDGQLHGHINWHLALCELEAGDAAAAFRTYADSISPEAARGPPLIVMTDTVAFLWRAELAGHPRDQVGWRAVHDFAHTIFPRAAIAFADTHAALADAVTGDNAALEARLHEMEDMARDGRLPSGPVVPALSRGFAAYLREDFAAAIAAIEPVFSQHERIGGSRAQRDLVEFTLLKAYMNAGRMDDVRRMLSQRRPGPAGIPVAGLPHAVGE
jgi:tetratricopeptide (TPR) repeat protein